MMGLRFRRWCGVFVRLSTVVVLIAGLATCGWTCNIPVFRYALENWQPDHYVALVISHGPLSADAQQAVRRLETAIQDPDRLLNLQVATIDLNDAQAVEQLTARFGDALPAASELQSLLTSWYRGATQLVLLYPRALPAVAWQGDLTEAHVDAIIDSPARSEIGRRLLAGDSVVWVFVDSGDASKDQAAWEQFNGQLEHVSRVVEMPAKKLIQGDELLRADVQVELQVKFSSLRIAHDDARESVFRACLRNSEDDLAEFAQEPLVVPIYGRGRAHYALVGQGIQPDTIRDEGQFLCAACSCQVKRENPGIDMLMAVAWEKQLVGRPSSMPELPPLSGIGDLATAVPASTNVAAETNSSYGPNPGDLASVSTTTRRNADIEEVLPRRDRDLKSPTIDGFTRRILVGVCASVGIVVVTMYVAMFRIAKS